jgi:DNA-binding MarR family transcriptional regulator
MSTNRAQPQKREEILENLKWAGRRESRASLLFRHAVAEKAGLHVTDSECIDFLLEAGSATAGELAKITGLTTGAMTAAIDRLEKAGFVARERDPQDRRKVIVRPVLAEITKFALLYESMEEALEELLSEYTLAELELLIRHYNRMAELYEKQVSKL